MRDLNSKHFLGQQEKKGHILAEVIQHSFQFPRNQLNLKPWKFYCYSTPTFGNTRKFKVNSNYIIFLS